MRIALGIIIGSIIGLGVWYFAKCTSGTCPLTSNPIITTLVGASIGLMLTLKP